MHINIRPMDPVPVVLVHGALRSRAGMAPTAAYLRRRGFDARCFGYRARLDRIEEHAARLEDFLDRWLGGGSRPPTLGFLTHSMGGLVVRSYLGRPAREAQSTRQRVVMLAPPNGGAHLADRYRDRGWFRAVYGAAAVELTSAAAAELPGPPRSAALLILAGGRGDDRGYHPLIPGDNDGLVGLDETRLPGHDPIFVGGIHGLLQWRRDVLDRAVRFLGPEEPEPLA